MLAQNKKKVEEGHERSGIFSAFFPRPDDNINVRGRVKKRIWSPGPVKTALDDEWTRCAGQFFQFSRRPGIFMEICELRQINSCIMLN